MRELGSLDASPEKGGAPLPTAQSQERPPCDRRAHSVTVFLTPTLRNLGCLTEGAWVGRKNQCFAHRGLSAPAVLERSWTPRMNCMAGSGNQSFILLSLASCPPPPLCSFQTLSFSTLLSPSRMSPPLLPLFQSLFLSLTHTPPLSLWGQLPGFPLKRQEKFVTNVFSSKKIH